MSVDAIDATRRSRSLFVRVVAARVEVTRCRNMAKCDRAARRAAASSRARVRASTSVQIAAARTPTPSSTANVRAPRRRCRAPLASATRCRRGRTARGHRLEQSESPLPVVHGQRVEGLLDAAEAGLQRRDHRGLLRHVSLRRVQGRLRGFELRGDLIERGGVVPKLVGEDREIVLQRWPAAPTPRRCGAEPRRATRGTD